MHEKIIRLAQNYQLMDGHILCIEKMNKNLIKNAHHIYATVNSLFLTKIESELNEVKEKNPVYKNASNEMPFFLL